MIGLRAQLKNNRFRQIDKQIRAAEQKARVGAANTGAAVARQLAPVDTGFLKSQIAVLQGGYGGVRLISGAPYSAFVNYGTVYQAPQPFFSTGTEAMRKDLARQYRRMRLR